MPNEDGWDLPHPRDETIWEGWVHILLTKKFQRPAPAYGRRGQKQNGLDFVVDCDKERIGVQCKHVSHGSKLDVDQVEADIIASRLVTPKIDKFLLYTSASSDVATVDKLSALCAKVRADGVDFQFHMWRDFESEARDYGLLPTIYGQLLENISYTVTKPSGESTSLVDSGRSSGVPTVLSSEILEVVKEKMAIGDIAAASSMVDFMLSTPQKLNDSQLATAYATKAILLSRESNSTEAATFWRRAVEIEPESLKKHGRLSFALICENRYEEALAEALQGLSSPELAPSSLAAVAAVISASHVGRWEEVEAILSARLKSERDVLLVRAHAALTAGDMDITEVICGILARDHPNDPDAISIRADAIFQRALGGRSHVLPDAITGKERDALEVAEALYRQTIGTRNPVLERAIWLPSALNLISVLKLLEKHQAAGEIAEAIVQKQGTDIEDFPRLLLAMAEGDRSTKVIALTDGVEDVCWQIKLARASALMHLGQFSEATPILDYCLTETSGMDADNLRWLKLWSIYRSQATSDFEQLAETYFEEASQKVSACRRIMEAASSKGFPNLAKKFAKIAVDTLQKDPDPNQASFLADAMIILDDLDGASEHILSVVDLENPEGGPLEERLAYCLLRTHRFETLGKLLEALVERRIDTTRFAPYRANYHIARGDLPQALIAVQQALELKPSNLEMRAQEVCLIREMGDPEEAKRKLSAIPYESNPAQNGIALYMREARALNEQNRAEDFLYRWIRDNANNPDNVAWFIGDFLMTHADTNIESLSSVTRQCGICLQSTSGEHQLRWLVIDDRINENVAGGWYTSQSLGMRALIGQPLHANVTLPSFPGGPFTITSITSVLEGTAKILLNRYGKSMPMAKFLQFMTIQQKNGEHDFTQIFEQLDFAKEQSLRAFSVYNENPVPLGMLARAMSRNPIDIWAGLCGDHEHRLRAELTVPSNSNSFSASAIKEAPHIILDPIVLFSWACWDVLSLAVRSSKSICMPATAVNILREKLAEMNSFGNGQQMILAAGDRPGTYERTEITPAIRKRQAELYEKIFDWITQHVEILPVPVTGIPENIYAELRHSSIAYVADQLQLASHQNATLVADDVGIQVLATSLKLHQTSSRLFFLSAVKRKVLSHSRFSMILGDLTKANYDFVSYSSDDLLAASGALSFPFIPHTTEHLLSMLRYLRIPTLGLQSGFHVFLHFLIRLTIEGAHPTLVNRVTTEALSALTLHCTRQPTEIIQLLLQVASQTLSEPYRNCVIEAAKHWSIGHMITWESLVERNSP